jgi:hypothetical protein
MGWVVSVTPRPRFTPGERTHGTHCTGGWVGPRAGLDTEARGKISCLYRGSNVDRPVVQTVGRHYTDWATPAHSVYFCTPLFHRCSTYIYIYISPPLEREQPAQPRSLVWASYLTWHYAGHMLKVTNLPSGKETPMCRRLDSSVQAGREVQTHKTGNRTPEVTTWRIALLTSPETRLLRNFRNKVLRIFLNCVPNFFRSEKYWSTYVWDVRWTKSCGFWKG